MRFSLLRALLAAAVLLAVPANASAAFPITFDDQAAGTQVDTEYTASDGVTFIDDAMSTDLPIVTSVGAAANSGANVAMSGCVGVEFCSNVVKGRFAQSQESVSMRVGIVGDPGLGARTVTLIAYNGAGVEVGSTSVQASVTDFTTAISLDPTGSDNVVFFRVLAPPSGWQIGIDDLNAVDNGASPPEIGLSVPTSGIRVRQGGSTQVVFHVLRSNGSSGDIALSMIDLPPGTTASFSPTSLTGTSEGPVTMTLTSSNSASLAEGGVTGTIVATPADALVGSATSSHAMLVVVEPSFRVTAPTTVAIPSCGSTIVNVNVTRAFSGFTGDVTLSVGSLPSGYTATLEQTVVGAPSGGAFANVVPLTITRTGSGSMDSFPITVTGTSGSLPTRQATMTATRFAGEVTSITPTLGSVPRDLMQGTPVTITGRGLCAGSQVQFGNSFASVTPTGTEIGPGNTTFSVRIPRLATTGRVTVAAPDGSFSSTEPVTINTPRNTEGFKFENYDHDGVGLDELRYVYGEAQTNITLDLCWPFDCTVVTPIPSPFAGLFILISNAALEGNGSCYGIAISSQQLVTGRVPYSRFQSGVSKVWDLSSTTGPNPALKRHIRAWHSTQLSSEAIQRYFSIRAANAIEGGRDVRAEVENELRAGRSPIIMLAKGFGGHVMVAHDVRSGASGGYIIDVYDPNLEFEAGEDSDGTAHRNREDASTIVVQSNGNWSMTGAYSGGPWTGDAGDLVHLPFGRIPSVPTLPSTLEGLFDLVVPFAAGSGATVTQVTDLNGHTLLTKGGELNTNAKSKIPGADIMHTMSGDGTRPVLLLPAKGHYTQTLRATETGTASAALIGPGWAGHVSGIPTKRGESEQVEMSSYLGELTVDARGPNALRARVVDGARNGAEYQLEVRTTGGDKGEHAFSLVGPDRVAAYENEGSGSASAAMTLTSKDPSGAPGTLTLPSVSVPAGGSAIAAPRSWTNLGQQVAIIVVKDAAGREISRRVVRPKAGPRYVRSVAATARTVRGTSRMVTVKATYGSVPRAARVFVVVQVRNARGKVLRLVRVPVAATTARGTKTYRVPVTLARGTYTVRASVGAVTTSVRGMQSSSKVDVARFVAR